MKWDTIINIEFYKTFYLIENKDILQQINEEDNPVIIQYKIKH